MVEVNFERKNLPGRSTGSFEEVLEQPTEPVKDLARIQAEAKARTAHLHAEQEAQLRRNAAIGNTPVEYEEEERQIVMPERAKEIDVRLYNRNREVVKVITMREVNIAVQGLENSILSAQKFQDEKMLSKAVLEVRSVLHVAAIDGVEVQRPTNWVQYIGLINKLGTNGFDAVGTAMMTYFPPMQEAEFEIVKKS